MPSHLFPEEYRLKTSEVEIIWPLTRFFWPFQSIKQSIIYLLVSLLTCCCAILAAKFFGNPFGTYKALVVVSMIFASTTLYYATPSMLVVSFSEHDDGTDRLPRILARLRSIGYIVAEDADNPTAITLQPNIDFLVHLSEFDVTINLNPDVMVIRGPYNTIDALKTKLNREKQ